MGTTLSKFVFEGVHGIAYVCDLFNGRSVLHVNYCKILRVR